MKLLHTSDWHIGRSFHGASTLENLELVLDALVERVRAEGVRAVLVAGDVFDTGTPSAASYALLRRTLRALHAAGAAVILTSGNHDSAERLGFQSEFAALAGIHVLADPERLEIPVVLEDPEGGAPAHIYGIPFLEPVLLRYRHPGVPLRHHEDALRFALDRIRAEIDLRAAHALAAGSPAPRTIVMAHCFATGAEGGDGERDITAGGVDSVPLALFDGLDYAALGHIHGRATLRPRVRYSGAPLHFSFSEAQKPRGAWLIDTEALDEPGEAVTWLPLPVPRGLSILTGTLEELLADERHEGARGDWVSARLTDRVRPVEPMRELRARFPHVVALEHRPEPGGEEPPRGYAERVRARPDAEVISEFLGFVREGEGPSAYERALIAELIATHSQEPTA